MKRKAWRLVLVTLALFLLWVSEREERQGMDADCQAGVIPGFSASMEGPALRDAGFASDCEQGVGARGAASWESIPHAGDVARRVAEYLSLPN